MWTELHAPRPATLSDEYLARGYHALLYLHSYLSYHHISQCADTIGDIVTRPDASDDVVHCSLVLPGYEFIRELMLRFFGLDLPLEETCAPLVISMFLDCSVTHVVHPACVSHEWESARGLA